MLRSKKESLVGPSPITEENYLDAFHLESAPEQESFVSHPIRSLTQAYIYKDPCQLFGIYVIG